MINIKIGFGYDVHQLWEDYDFILGGIKIPYEKGTVGHSDADVLTHAICDAILGAANLRDIGFQFPDSSAEFKGIDSKILLKRVMDLVKEKGYAIGNIDTTVALQDPKIGPYIEAMKAELAPILEITVDNISIKATTTEKMGYIGRGEGVAAFCNVLIYKK
jgi:2-C-methyl-D-erythritol 2,4-cyclodiphosphate synthase